MLTCSLLRWGKWERAMYSISFLNFTWIWKDLIFTWISEFQWWCTFPNNWHQCSCPNITVITMAVGHLLESLHQHHPHLSGCSFLPELHNQQLVEAFLQLLGEVSVKGILAERLRSYIEENSCKSCYHVMKYIKVIIKRICTERLQWDHDHHQLFNVSNPIKRLEFQSLSDISREFSPPRQSPHS